MAFFNISRTSSIIFEYIILGRLLLYCMNNKSPPPRRPALRARPVPAPPQADHRAEGAAGEREEHRGQDDQGQVL